MTARIDAHAHLWVLDRTPQPWIDPVTMTVIARDHEWPDLSAAHAGHDVQGVVLVQSASSADETRWLLEVAREHATVVGVVGWVDLSGQVVPQLDALRDAPGAQALRGVRHTVHQEAGDGWFEDLGVRAGLDALGRSGLVFDLVLRPDQLRAATAATAATEGTTFVLDHLGNPPVAAGGTALREWADSLRRLARLPNVVGKLSGLAMSADHGGWTPHDLRPAVEVALETFGPQRLMVGSDWPVVELVGGQGRWWAAVDELLAPLDPGDRDRILVGTADSVYGAARA